MTTPADITAFLFEKQDTAYRDFQKKLIPTVQAERIIGVRTPVLRALAKELSRSKAPETRDAVRAFLGSLPHRYFDENQLHAFLISELKDFDAAISETERFLPYIDNWATSDQLSPRAFKKHRAALLPHIRSWLKSPCTYTVRFAIGMLMQHFLDEDFASCYLSEVAAIRSQEYYIRMMQAWYFATALAKQYEAALPFIEQQKLDSWTHNKAIQKACESFRVTDEHKLYLKTLKV